MHAIGCTRNSYRVNAMLPPHLTPVSCLGTNDSGACSPIGVLSGTSQSQQNCSADSCSSESLVEALRRDIQEASQRLEMTRAEKAKIESEASDYQNLATKTEADLKSLSDAYNSLEQTNFHLEKELKSLRNGGAISGPDVAALKAEAREEAQKETDAELNDLLVCLGQEQSKVERLSARLTELGEDVEKLLEGVGDETVVPEDDDED